MKEPVHCINCLRWYATGANQCNVPCRQDIEHKDFQQALYGEVKTERNIAYEFLKSKQENVMFSGSRTAYGHPSQLNINNDCIFYKGLPKYLRFLTKFLRNWF